MRRHPEYASEKDEKHRAGMKIEQYNKINEIKTSQILLAATEITKNISIKLKVPF